ncbi:hypothetical protein M426DRAFT_149912 [Hypoxylon sp. CI-4A]|nr:hypothetical protein M426DRAFT_149912 [Hypoxylon sp. CI-4A]
MKCRGAVTLSFLAGVLAGVMADDIVGEIRRDFQMSLFARQQLAGKDFQRFNAALGNMTPAQIVLNDGDDSEQKPFKIVGGTRSDGETFSDFNSASNRVCDDQKNDCADLSNNGGADFEVSSCDQQDNDCKDANKPTDEDDSFLYFCDD